MRLDAGRRRNLLTEGHLGQATSGLANLLDEYPEPGPGLIPTLFPLLIAVVIALITDIDTPRGGLITVDERPLLELNDSLK